MVKAVLFWEDTIPHFNYMVKRANLEFSVLP